jgi:16S rRNA (cytosine1402-N4)-methyltransferase
MAAEVVELLATAPAGAYIDLTVGSGGHLSRLAEALPPPARLFGVDRDPAAIERTRQRFVGSNRDVKLIRATYADLAEIAIAIKEPKFQGILLDLGLSSEQLDDPQRGFAFRSDGPLDMRFNSESNSPGAAELIGTASEERLTEILRDYGQERMAKRMARAIVRERQKMTIGTTGELARVLNPYINPRHHNRTLARVFQALRIAVNSELEQLTQVLPVIVDHLAVGGRVAAMSYHSLEDRIVKQFFQREARDCLCPPRLPACICGHTAQLKIVEKRGLVPSPDEQRDNPRSRSARLRVAERIVA